MTEQNSFWLIRVLGRLRVHVWQTMNPEGALAGRRAATNGINPGSTVNQSCHKKVSWFSRLEKRLWGYLGSVIDEVSSSSVNKVVSIRDRNSNVIEDNIDGRKGDPSVGSHAVGGRSGENEDSGMACVRAQGMSRLDPGLSLIHI